MVAPGAMRPTESRSDRAGEVCKSGVRSEEDEMKKIPVIVLVLVATLAMTLYAQTTPGPDKVPLMSIDELKGKIDSPDIVIIDVRSSHDWDDSTTKIKGAVREDASKVAAWMAKYPPNKTLVFYCA
jgi:hypothetical protein